MSIFIKISRLLVLWFISTARSFTCHFTVFGLVEQGIVYFNAKEFPENLVPGVAIEWQHNLNIYNSVTNKCTLTFRNLASHI